MLLLMNLKVASQFRTDVCLGLILLLGWGGVSARAGTQTVPAAATVKATVPPREFVAVQSVFIDDLKVGKDPFFPGSVRRAPKVPHPSESVDPRNPPLTVKFILSGQHRRLAQINNRCFEPGEQAEVLVGGQKVKVRCLEIREKSVLLTVEGDNQSKEIFQRSP